MLRVYCGFDPREYASISKLPIYNVWQEGELRSQHSKRRNTSSGFSCVVSSQELLADQVIDTIAFLKKYEAELQEISNLDGIEESQLDFGYDCRLHEPNIAMQGEYLPSELLSLAGSLNLSIALSLYPPDFEQQAQALWEARQKQSKQEPDSGS